MTDLTKLAPCEVWTEFEAITRVPRPSKKEEKIRDYLVGWAKEHGLEYRCDATGNVVIRKPATTGYEGRPTVILQSHMDMVCEKNSDVAFDFEHDAIRTRIDEAMKLAGIYEKREAAPYKLSGGQKQRVAIAGVIAMRPDCLVMDESTAMLDPHGRAQVMKTIRQLRAAGITIVSITHYMEEAAQADRVLVMSRGRIVMEGTPEQVFSQTERLHGYHLDVPQAAELRDELVKAGIPMPENVITPDACAEELYKLLK